MIRQLRLTDLLTQILPGRLTADDRVVTHDEIGARRQVGDSVQDRRPLSLEYDFLGVGVQLAGAEAAAGGKTAQPIR